MRPTANDAILLGAGTRVNDRLEISKVLGHGPVSTCYLVHPIGDAQRQLLLRSYAPTFEDFSAIESAAGLTHPNMVNQYFGESDLLGRFNVSEIEPGLLLSDFMSSDTGFLLDEIVYFLHEIAKAFEHAHKNDVGHYYLHPGNVLVTADGEVKVLNFGMSVLVQEIGGAPMGIRPAPTEYFAPEQIKGEVLDERTDIYALGVLIYRLFARGPLFSAISDQEIRRKILERPAPLLSTINAAIPKWIVSFVDRALSKDPQKRFTSFTEVVELLRPHLSDGIKIQLPKQPKAISEALFKKRLSDDEQVLVEQVLRAPFQRIMVGVIWFIPVYLSVNIMIRLVFGAAIVAQYGQEVMGGDQMKLALDGFYGRNGVIIFLIQVLLTLCLGALGKLPGTTKFSRIYAKTRAGREKRKEELDAPVPGYVWAACSFPALLILIGGLIGGVLGGLAIGISIEAYKLTRSLPVSVMASIILAQVAFFVWLLIVMGA